MICLGNDAVYVVGLDLVAGTVIVQFADEPEKLVRCRIEDLVAEGGIEEIVEKEGKGVAYYRSILKRLDAGSSVH
ncbi:hypothetical protein MYX75_05535 [Acidobacteria bacterium AH-259-A15]|nr:hypothetical protein [Acidobacteria bacterium AH-259-A15]